MYYSDGSGRKVDFPFDGGVSPLFPALKGIPVRFPGGESFLMAGPLPAAVVAGSLPNAEVEGCILPGFCVLKPDSGVL